MFDGWIASRVFIAGSSTCSGVLTLSEASISAMLACGLCIKLLDYLPYRQGPADLGRVDGKSGTE
ncbi:UNVERIFIED_CONTAM: hypothetical protein NY603_35030, partial [Bacteroidetes bacterium 56_B9]